jgi:hypothetical protein
MCHPSIPGPREIIEEDRLMDRSLFSPLELRGELLCDVHLEAQADGPGRIDSPWGAHRIDYIEDGEFEGPKLKGRVLPGGGDWPAISNDGRHSMRVNVRAVWETHDGARLFVQYYGFIVFPDGRAGPIDMTTADPSAYYFRVAPTFQTGDERYLWLNTVLCVGLGRFTKTGLGYRIYEIR